MSQNYRERTHKGHACVERSKAEGIKQQAERRHKGNACGPEPPRTNSTLPIGMGELGARAGGARAGGGGGEPVRAPEGLQ
eukprot:363336-Chlamydomonas_euryale.AAC.9